MSIDGDDVDMGLRRLARDGSARVRKNSSRTSFSLVAEDQSDRSAHPSRARPVPAKMLPKLPDGTAKATSSPSRGRRREVRLEVIDDLRRDARPVDRVDRADTPCFALNAASPDTAFTIAWQSSNVPSIAML